MERSLDKSCPYDPKEVADIIAGIYGQNEEYDNKTVIHNEENLNNHDTFNNKVMNEGRFGTKEKYGVNLYIKTREDFSRHIQDTILNNETKVFSAINNRDIYYNEKTNTTVIINKNDLVRSTCYRDSKKKEGYERLKERDNFQRDGYQLGELKEFTGGISGIYHDLQNERPSMLGQNLLGVAVSQEGKAAETSRADSAYPPTWNAEQIAAYERATAEDAAQQQHGTEHNPELGRGR